MSDTLRVAINDEIKYKADLKTDKRAAASLTYRFTVYDLTLDEFVVCITARENFTAVCLDEEGRFHRAKKYFRRMDVTAVDVDNDGAVYLSLDAALAHPFVQQYAALLYTTASFKPDHHKFRVVFWLAEPITDRERAENLIAALIWKFGSDESCKDASRFFYGAGADGQVILLGHRLTNSGIDELLKEYELAHRVEPPLPHEPTGVASWSGYVFEGDKDKRRARYAQRAIDTATQIINNSRGPIDRQSGTGNRHNSRLRAAYLLGGYVGSGLLSESEARAALELAVRNNTDNFRAAMETVEDGLRDGRNKPITFEQLEAERARYLRARRKAKVAVSLSPLHTPEYTIRLGEPSRPTDTLRLTKPSRPIVTTKLYREVAR